MPLSALAQFVLKTPTYHDVWIKIPHAKSALKTSQTHVALKTSVLEFIVYPSPPDEKVKASYDYNILHFSFKEPNTNNEVMQQQVHVCAHKPSDNMFLCAHSGPVSTLEILFVVTKQTPFCCVFL